MNGFWIVLFSFFALGGFIGTAERIYRAVRPEHNDEIYVFFGKEKALDGKWDVLIASDDCDGILEALSEKYGRIYILRGADRWTKEEKPLKEVLKK